MKICTSSNILFIFSVVFVVLALFFAGSSLSGSVKWNVYDSATDFGFGFDMYQIYAYQNLWTSFDIWNGVDDKKHAQAYDIIKQDYWRRIPRTLIIVSLVIGALSLGTLLMSGLIPKPCRKPVVLNIFRICTCVLSVTAGCMQAYSLDYYKTRFRLLLCPAFHDPYSHYPDEDNVTTGFYLVCFASAFLIMSAVFNLVNVTKTVVDPVQEPSMQ